MRIERIELRLLRLPLVRFFETSFGRVHDRAFLLVTLEGEGATGVGECVADANPFYSAETTRTAWHIIDEFIAPLVLDRAFAHPRDVFPALAGIRGHNMAKAAIEMAAWDLYAKQQGLPLCRVLGGSDALIASGIASGVSIGIQDSLEELSDRVGSELAAGYQRIKIKIKPGWDIAAVETVRKGFGDVPLMVDANAAYSLADAPWLMELDRFDLMMIEQPLDYDDIRDHARLQQEIRTPICLDESLHTVKIAEEAMADGACRIINIKPGRVGGHRESIRLHDAAASHARSRVAWRHARDRDRPRAQYSPVDPAEFHTPGRRGRQPPLLRARPDRSRDRGQGRWNHQRARRSRHRGPDRAGPRRGRDRSTSRASRHALKP